MDPTPEIASEQVAPPIPFRDISPDAPDEEAIDEREREAAFAHQATWAGRPLQPFSISRSACWLQHRVALGAPDLATCLRDLDAFLADAGRILWLCSVSPAEFAALRGNPAAMQAAIDAWMDEHIQPGQQAEATLAAFRIYSSSIANRHIPAPSKNAHADDLGN